MFTATTDFEKCEFTSKDGLNGKLLLKVVKTVSTIITIAVGFDFKILCSTSETFVQKPV